MLDFGTLAHEGISVVDELGARPLVRTRRVNREATDPSVEAGVAEDLRINSVILDAGGFDPRRGLASIEENEGDIRSPLECFAERVPAVGRFTRDELSPWKTLEGCEKCSIGELLALKERSVGVLWITRLAGAPRGGSEAHSPAGHGADGRGKAAG